MAAMLRPPWSRASAMLLHASRRARAGPATGRALSAAAWAPRAAAWLPLARASGRPAPLHLLAGPLAAGSASMLLGMAAPARAHADALPSRAAPPALLAPAPPADALLDGDPDAPEPDDAEDAPGLAAAAALAGSEGNPGEALPLRVVCWRVLAAMSEDGWLFALAILASAIAAIAGVASAQHIGAIMDIISDGGHPSTSLARAVAELVGVYAVRAVLTFASATVLSMAVNRLSARLQTQLVGALLEQDISFFDGAAHGALAQSVASDVKEATGALKHLLQNGVQMLTAVLGGGLSLLSLSRRLSFVMLTAIPLTTLLFHQFGAYVRALSRRERAASAAASSIVAESVGNIRTVQSFVAERLEAARFEAEVQSALSLRHSLGVLRGAFFGLLSFALHGVTAVVVAVGGSLVASGQMTHGDVSAYMSQVREVIQAFGGLARLADEARDGAVAMRRVVELLERTPALLGPADGLRPERVDGRVEFLNVHFAYPARPDVPVLRGLNLDLEAGKVTALVGDSGSGKTTVAWLLERFYDPARARGDASGETDAGVVLLDGVPLPLYDVRWLRRRVGLVSQEPVLFATSIEANILYGDPDASGADVRAAAQQANAHRFIEAFPEGYAKRLGAGGAGLSGGQKQRVAIARALLKQPAILILDEATSALDARSERVVLDALDAGLLEGRTTLVIAHRLSTVKRADKIAVLKDGRVVEQGTHAELIARGGVYASLVRLQLSGDDAPAQ